MSAILKVCQNCCPWFWGTPSLSAYQKRLGETEHQQFMKQVIESPSHDNLHGINKRKSQTNKGHIKPITNNVLTDQTMHTNSGQVTVLKKMNKIESQDILSAELPLPKKVYTDCIDKNHPYFGLLYQKLQLLTNIFQLDAAPEPKLAENQYNLKIINKQSDDDKTNIFVYSFSFPTSYEFYEGMQNNFELQRSFDNNIDRYQCKQKLDEATKIMYLAYKKILIVSPRDFVYIRYTFKKGNQNWTIAASLPDAETEQGKTRGTIILTATRAIQREDRLQLTVYSQVDMKMPVKASAAKVRGLTEIKKYLDKCYDYVQKQKNNII